MPAGLGSLDAQGVWQFGEDDTDALFSDLLNLGMESASTQFGLDRARLDRRKLESYEWPTASDRTSQTGMSAGDTGIQQDTGVLYLYIGGGWKPWESDWGAYPAANPLVVANFTKGAGGTISDLWRYAAGMAEVAIDITMGSGSAMGSNPTCTLPVNMHAGYKADAPIGLPSSATVAGGPYDIAVLRNSSDVNKIAPYVRTASGTYVGFANLTSAVPATWGTTGILQLRARFRPA